MITRGLIAGFLCGTALLLSVPAWAQVQEIRPIRTITVNGNSKQFVVPDEAHVTVNLNAQDMNLATAKDAHDKKLEKLMKIVADHKIDKQKVSTQSSNVHPVYTYETNPKTGGSEQIFKGYRVQSMIDVKVSDTSKLGKLLDVIAKAKFDDQATPEWGNLINLYYTLSEPEKLREELLTKAIGNAKTKADKMASAAGAKVSRVFQINETGGFNPQPYPVAMLMAGKMAMDSAPAAPGAPPAGEQQIDVTVTVTYELE